MRPQGMHSNKHKEWMNKLKNKNRIEEQKIISDLLVD